MSNTPLRGVFVRIVIALVLVVPVGAVAAETACPQQLWLIDARELPRCGGAEIDATGFDYQRCDDAGQWISAGATAFYAASEPAVPTAFFVHGNRVDRCEAMQEGRDLYRVLQRAAGERPLRVVIWSWPSDRIRGLRADAQVKAARSDVQAYYLATCLDRMSPKVPLNLIGHSFGGRVILGAMHLLGGGEFAGQSLPANAKRPTRAIRAVVAAAAMDNASLLPERRNGLALGQMERLLLTCNANDPVLRWYPLMYGRGGPEALGYTGPACPSRLGDDREKIELLNVACSVGNSHGWADYLCSSAFRDRVAKYTLGDEK
jgi:hypothetical protein